MINKIWNGNAKLIALVLTIATLSTGWGILWGSLNADITTLKTRQMGKMDTEVYLRDKQYLENQIGDLKAGQLRMENKLDEIYKRVAKE